MVFQVLSAIKIKVSLKPKVDNFVFQLHYRYTYILFLLCAVLATFYDAVGKAIQCMLDSDSESLKEMLNSYCFIMGTFTIDRLHEPEEQDNVPHPGVGPREGEEPITVHSYYQWVPFVLFGQAILFYLPHFIWKTAEGGLFVNIIQNLAIRDYLGGNLRNYEGRDEKYNCLSEYIKSHVGLHQFWAIKFFICEFLNLAVVISMLFFTNWFLGGEFLTYGTEVFQFIRLDPENRTDPMSYVFPQMAKCTFKLFGPSGGIRVVDVMCLLATNVINEKVYVCLWVWIIVLLSVTSAWSLFRMATLVSSHLRQLILKHMARFARKSDVSFVMSQVKLGDWFLLCQLGRNMEQSVFSEFISHLASALKEELPDSMARGPADYIALPEAT